MTTVEIRQKKSYFTIIFMPLLVISFAYYVFLSGSPQVTTAVKYSFFALLIYSVYMIYTDIKRRKSNRPNLIISEFSIEILGDFKTNVYLWQDLKNWKIELDEGAHYLVIETYSQKRRVAISCLDKTPAEIEILLNTFAGKLRSAAIEK